MRTIMYELVNPICKIIQGTNPESVEDVIRLQMHLIVYDYIFDIVYKDGLITLDEYSKLYQANTNTIMRISRTLYRRTYNVEDLLYYYKQLFK